MTVLRCTDITVKFGGHVALRGVSIDVDEGEILGIVGPNGAGKTTLFDVITGVRRPLTGRLALNGVDITSWPAHRRTRNGLSRSFQTVGLMPGLSARENLLATLEAKQARWHGFSSSGESQRLEAESDELLHFFQLEEYCASPVTDIPLGAMKLLEMAKVFTGSPRVVLLDEPFAGIAHEESLNRVELLVKRHRLSGAALVIIEHDVALLTRMCDRLVVLDYGQVIAAGDPSSVINSDDVRRAYFGELPERVRDA